MTSTPNGESPDGPPQKHHDDASSPGDESQPNHNEHGAPRQNTEGERHPGAQIEHAQQCQPKPRWQARALAWRLLIGPWAILTRRWLWAKNQQSEFWFGITSLMFDFVVMVAAVVGGYFIYDQLRLMRASNSHTLRGLEFAEKQARDSADDDAKRVAREEAARRLEHRAWVGANRPSDSFDAPTGDQPLFTITITNTGRTPALGVASIVALQQQDDSFDDRHLLLTLDLKDSHVSDQISESFSGTILPDMNVALKIPPMNTKGAPRDPRKWTTYLYGRITYNDVFETSHVTTFCFVSAGHTSKKCDKYNNAN